MRFSLFRMLVVVALIALGCAGLMYRTGGWTSIIVSVTIVLYVVVIFRAVGQRAQERAFYSGFATVGVAYLLLATCSFFGSLRESLGTNYPLALASRSIGAKDPEFGLGFYGYKSGGTLSLGNTYTGSTYVSGGTLTIQGGPNASLPLPLEVIISSAMSSNGSAIPLGRFFLIGHCLWSWLFAFVAGWIAERMYARRHAANKCP